jgi:2-dehydropantoate 2-reductase
MAMKVSVIGGGAIGLLVSYYLKKNHFNPVIYTRTNEQAKGINQSGITYINPRGQAESVDAEARPIEAYSGSEDLCIIAVKQTSIDQLQFLHHENYKRVSLLFLQNGISHIKFVENLPQKNILLGVVEHGAMKEGLTSVHHLGEGKIKAAIFKGSRTCEWQAAFPREDFPFSLEKDWERMLYEKLVMNAAINPVTALLRIPNGELIANKYAYHLMRKLFEETITVLHLDYQKKELWEELLSLCRNTSLNRSSMLKSVESGDETEIQAITGEILEAAKAKNIDAPYSEFAYCGVKALDWRG